MNRKLHWVTSKVYTNKGFIHFARDPMSLYFDKRQKKLSSLLTFTFSVIKNLDDKSYISAKIEE